MSRVDLDAMEVDLRTALARHHARRSRRRRKLVAGALASVTALGLCAVAVASGIGGDLQLDPRTWSILGSGSVDDGRGEYVHAKRTADDTSATFMVEHDAGLPAYERFLLHQKTLAAAQASSPESVRIEPGPLCAAAALTRAEQVALSALRSTFPNGAGADESAAQVDKAVHVAFADAPCKGLDYAGEQARLVYAGTEPETNLMLGARP